MKHVNVRTVVLLFGVLWGCTSADPNAISDSTMDTGGAAGRSGFSSGLAATNGTVEVNAGSASTASGEPRAGESSPAWNWPTAMGASSIPASVGVTPNGGGSSATSTAGMELIGTGGTVSGSSSALTVLGGSAPALDNTSVGFGGAASGFGGVSSEFENAAMGSGDTAPDTNVVGSDSENHPTNSSNPSSGSSIESIGASDTPTGSGGTTSNAHNASGGFGGFPTASGGASMEAGGASTGVGRTQTVTGGTSTGSGGSATGSGGATSVSEDTLPGSGGTPSGAGGTTLGTGSANTLELPPVPTELGMIVGVVWEPDRQQLYLVGDERPRVTPSEQMIASALWITAHETNAFPWMSIDPLPGALDGPWMNVTMAPSVQDSELGYTMFEADRRLKSLSLGRDSLTQEPLISGVEGFKNMLTLGFEQLTPTAQAVWSRFWLEPAVSYLESSPTSLNVVSSTMQVNTEVMVIRNGQLGPAEAGEHDPRAEELARFFTKRYDELAREDSIFARLEQVHRLLTIGEWVREHEIPIDRSWMIHNAELSFRMPRSTPSLRVSATRVSETEQVSIQLFGGVSFAGLASNEAAAGSSSLGLRDAVLNVARGQTERRFGVMYQSRSYQVLALPSREPNAPDPSLRRILDTALPDDASLPIFARSSMAANHGEQELCLPRLVLGNPSERLGGEELVQVDDTLFPVRWYEFVDEHGRVRARFEEHLLDVTTNSLYVAPTDPNSEWGLYRPSIDVVILTNGREYLEFLMPDGRLSRYETATSRLNYLYDDVGNGLRQIRLERGESTPILDVKLGGNGTIPLAVTRTSDGMSVELQPQAALVAPISVDVTTERGTQETVLIDANGNWTGATNPELRFLDRWALSLARAAANTAGRPLVVPAGGLALAMSGNSVRVVPVPVTEFEQLSSLLTIYQTPTFLGAERYDASRTAIVSQADTGLVLDWVTPWGRQNTVEDRSLAIATYQGLELNRAQGKTRSDVALQAVAIHGDRITIGQGYRRVTLPLATVEEFLNTGTGAAAEVLRRMVDGASGVIAVSSAISGLPVRGPDLLRAQRRSGAAMSRDYSDDKQDGALRNYPRLRGLGREDIKKVDTLSTVAGSLPLQLPSIGIVQSAASDSDIQTWLQVHQDEMVGKGLLVLREGYSSDSFRASRWIAQYGLTSLLDQKHAISAEAAEAIIRALDDLLNTGAKYDLSDLVRDAATRALERSDLTPEVRLELERFRSEALIQISLKLDMQLGNTSKRSALETRGYRNAEQQYRAT